ncbi:hypothetical protein [Rhodococcoides fascians]|uniref:hypothetical protein n=1 Tax=Rhodococcoides fascians TaxID=1828 RepID=UPI000ABF6F79
MVAGIALLGVVTATLASWLVQKVAEQDDANQAATQQQVAELTFQIASLRTELALRPDRRCSAESSAPEGTVSSQNR